MTDVATLISSWQEADGALPRLTWYGPGGERVELSGQVLANWVIKVANLLTEEADADDGSEVLIDLPVHWRTLAWSLGAWLVGAQVRFGPRVTGGGPHGAPTGSAAATVATGGTPEAPAGNTRGAPGGDTPDVIVTDQPEQTAGSEVLIAVALPALAMAFDGDLPPGAIDGAADLMTYPDELVMPTEPAGLDEISGPAWDGAKRVLVDAGSTGVVGQVLAIWRAGGSVVLVADPDADHDHLAGSESAALTSPANR